jgi:7-cyano-7-deazaguanine reductase
VVSPNEKRPITIVQMTTSNLPLHDRALPLGKESSYPDRYDPALLYPIARVLGRQAIGVSAGVLPFVGWDLWRGYELSWLTPKGVPQIALLKVWVPATSPNIVESKSFKLYLNSLNGERFKSTQAVTNRIKNDISKAAGETVRVEVLTPEQFDKEPIEEPGHRSVCIDTQDIEIVDYEPNAQLLALKPGQSVVTESVFSRLLKSNCPVTGQPDWASIHIQYHGAAIDHAALLRYVVSFRHHQGFHEQCVEQMFCDLMHHCQPQTLSIYARYTRRGGIDINPWRATPEMTAPNLLRSAQQ